jgi:hypothetical protein
MPSTTSVRVLGIREVRQLLADVAASARALAGLRVRALSREAYAQGIRTGRHPGGGLARRAGGTYAIDHARDAVVPQMGPVLAAALEQGPVAATAVVVDAAERIVRIVQQTEAERSGNLRRSYHVERG